MAQSPRRHPPTDGREWRLAEVAGGAEAARTAHHLKSIRPAPAEEEWFDDPSRGDARSECSEGRPIDVGAGPPWAVVHGVNGDALNARLGGGREPSCHRT